jgi:hypothetical protein
MAIAGFLSGVYPTGSNLSTSTYREDGGFVSPVLPNGTKVTATQPTAPSANKKATLTSPDGAYKTVVDVGSDEADKLLRQGWKLGATGKTVVSTSNGKVTTPATSTTSKTSVATQPTGSFADFIAKKEKQLGMSIANPEQFKTQYEMEVAKQKASSQMSLNTTPLEEAKKAGATQTSSALRSLTTEEYRSLEEKAQMSLNAPKEQYITTPTKVNTTPSAFSLPNTSTFVNTQPTITKTSTASTITADKNPFISTIGTILDFTLNPKNNILLGKGQKSFETLTAPAVEKITAIPAVKKTIETVGRETSGLSIVSRVQSLSPEKTYKEAYDIWTKKSQDTNNPTWKKFLYQLGDSGPQTLLGVALSFVPYAGKALSTTYWSAVSASDQLKTTGKVSSLTNIGIDVVGDRMLGTSIEGLLKAGSKSLVTTMVKNFGVEGGTEVSQDLLKYVNNFNSAKTVTEQAEILKEVKKYFTSGQILMTLGVGGVMGAAGGAGGFALQQKSYASQIAEGEKTKENTLINIAQKTNAPTFQKIIETTTAKDFLKQENITPQEFYEKANEKAKITETKPAEVVKPEVKPAISTDLQPLYQEAKSAEEFVKKESFNPMSKFEYHLSDNPNLIEGKTFAEQTKPKNLGERGFGGKEENIGQVFSTKNPQQWSAQLNYEGNKKPQYVYLVEVKNPAKPDILDGLPHQSISSPEEIRVIKKIGGQEVIDNPSIAESVKQSHLTDIWNKANATAEKATEIKTEKVKSEAELKAEQLKVSGDNEFKSRVYERLKTEYPDILTENVGYEKSSRDVGIEKAIKNLETNPQDAFDIAMRRKEGVSEVESVYTNITMSEKALDEGNTALYAKLIKNRSLAQTSRGQAIEAEKASVTDNNTSKYVKELIATRLENLGKKYLGNVKDVIKKTSTAKEKALNTIERKAGELGERIKNKKLDVKTALDLLEKIKCL